MYTATAAVETGTTVRIAVTVTDRPDGVAEAEEENLPCRFKLERNLELGT